jgi:hypothetical protein
LHVGIEVRHDILHEYVVDFIIDIRDEQA